MEFYTYDNAADIAKCLNCEKADCNNCLGNFYFANEDIFTAESEVKHG